MGFFYFPPFSFIDCLQFVGRYMRMAFALCELQLLQKHIRGFLYFGMVL